MNKHKVNRDRGFSIVEVMVAMAVLAISILGMAQLTALAVQQNSFARYNTAAVEIARGKLEELESVYSWELTTVTSSPDLTDGEHGPETVVLPSDTQTQGSRDFSVSWTVSSPSTTRKDIVITVRPAGVSDPESQDVLRSKTVTINSSLAP
ncbi:MAG: prepilin-type N-terminal cleavage/methylation domain-containing protein [Acidobacteriota bacterium]